MISFHIPCKYAINIPKLLLDKACVCEREREKGKPGREYGREYIGEQAIVSVTWI